MRFFFILVCRNYVSTENGKRKTSVQWKTNKPLWLQGRKRKRRNHLGVWNNQTIHLGWRLWRAHPWRKLRVKRKQTNGRLLQVSLSRKKQNRQKLVAKLETEENSVRAKLEKYIEEKIRTQNYLEQKIAEKRLVLERKEKKKM